jgi:CheY-like chemotaxis protein
MADVIALIDDIFFLAKVHETAKQTGVTLETASTGEQLLKAAAANPAALIVVDLNARQGALDAIERLCLLNRSSNDTSNAPSGDASRGAADGAGNSRRVVAFLSHVQTDLAERARAAGCTDVMARSMFTQNLAQILRGAKS